MARKVTKKQGKRTAHKPQADTVTEGFLLSGVRDEGATPSVLDRYATSTDSFRPGTARAGAPATKRQVGADDIVEIEFERGQRLWLNASDFHSQFGGGTARGAASGEVAVPDRLPMLPEGMAARGPVSWTIKGLKVLGFDPEGDTARIIAAKAETRPGLRRSGLGLARVPLATGAFPHMLQPEERIAAWGVERPYLLFLHGTLSSTWGSYGDLWSKPREKEMSALRKVYGDHALAFEHNTLTHSPIQNAAELLAVLNRTLPAGAKLHIVSHSRGGMVGELLCRKNGFSADELSLFDQLIDEFVALPGIEELSDADRDEAREAYLLTKEHLRLLASELSRKKFEVERFVRVACPALGTTLASERLDRWLSVVGSLAGAALPGTPWVEAFSEFGDFVAAVIRERTNPATLPGLEAMMPGSPCVRLLNWHTARAEGNLRVIAGDIDPDKWWADLLVWITDRFYDGDHDLVVNTQSMYGGACRDGDVLASFHKGPAVNHFSYFSNRASATSLVGGLDGSDADYQRVDLVQRTDVIAREARPKPSGPVPVVFVLPGLMGSELAAGKDRIWADVGNLALGGFGRLAVDARNVKATGLIESYYGRLCAYLEGSHKVIQFPYDWRLPIEQEAERLARALTAELGPAEAQGQPVRILAHSMGGLVAHAMLARHPGLWERVCKHPGSRLVLLGAPNGGMHTVVELLVGRSATVRKLGMLDIRHTDRDLAGLMSRFPGLLAMLPTDERQDFFCPSTWESVSKAAGNGSAWPTPDAGDLRRAAALRSLLDGHPLDPKRTCYVAGCADVTTEGVRIDPSTDDPGRALAFSATSRGDGRVTWESGLPPGVPTWFMNVEHGSMTDYSPAFAALDDLLLEGKTNRLSQREPIHQTAHAATFPLPRKGEILFPNEKDLIATALGAGSRQRRRIRHGDQPVTVRVRCGNLAFSRYPIVVGHYANDKLVSAEASIDRLLGGELARAHQLGIYPGEVNTSAVFFNPRLEDNPSVQPPGAIVVGIGHVGHLSAARLTETFSRALLDFASRWKGPEPCGRADGEKLGVTSLLIGTGTGGITVRETVFALLQGVTRANRKLRDSKQPQRIAELELVDLWEDKAIQVAKELVAQQQRDLQDGAFVYETRLVMSKGGQRRAYAEEPPGWWQRLQVLGQARPDQPADDTLRFSMLTRRARSEVSLHATQRALVDRFVEQSITSTRDNYAVARTLFELMLPGALKEQAPERDDLLVIVDEAAARYPWELMQDARLPGEPPFAVQRGMLRQLESFTFRTRVDDVMQNTALVIGDPVSSQVELVGAQEEAERVWSMLQERGFVAEKRIRPNAEEVIKALFERPWRILHLAGHGVYQYMASDLGQCDACGQPLEDSETAGGPTKPRLLTGMILGDDIVLSPGEVKQIRQVPELVFINCCHLGRIEADGDGARAGTRNDYHRIAANVATEFIRLGVRAVVAAGWAVDDDAALTFATALYGAMLDGRPFGKAVREARFAAYHHHRGVNTWGAYQCYGDPDYRLVRDAEGAGDGASSTIVAPSELVTEIENVTAGLATKAEDTRVGVLAWLDDLKRIAAENDWLRRGDVCAALGRAYGETGRFAEAVELYEVAREAEDGGMRLSHFEHLYNFQARHAAQQCGAGEMTVTKAADCIEEAIDGLKRMVPNVERLTLIASAYKRKSDVLASNSRRRPAALNGARIAYRKAYELAQERGGDSSYPLLNWLTYELICSWQKTPSSRNPLLSPEALREHLRDAKDPLEKRLAAEQNFWNAIMLVDRALLEALSDGILDDAEQERIAGMYRDGRKLASPREFDSVYYQLDYLHGLASPAMKQPLERIRAIIRGE